MEKIIKRITDDNIINGTFVFPDGVTKIGECAFFRCKSLEHIFVPDNIKKIEDHAFCGCENLKKISLPKNIILGCYVFLSCHADLEIERRN